MDITPNHRQGASDACEPIVDVGQENSPLAREISSSRSRISSVLSKTMIIGGTLVIAAFLALTVTGIRKTGYPISMGNQPDAFVKYAEIIKGEKLIRTISLKDGTSIEILGDPGNPDLPSRMVALDKALARVPLGNVPPHPARKIFIVFSKEKINDGEDAALTTPQGGKKTAFIILGPDATEESAMHELLHGLAQTDASKALPAFISEGIIYPLANPLKEKIIQCDDDYVLNHSSGLYMPSGQIGYEWDPLSSLQHVVMQMFWEKINKIDPTLIPKLLAYTGGAIGDISQIPGLLMQNGDPQAKPALRKFLSECDIFNAPQPQNIFLYPSVSEKNNPQIILFASNADHTGFDSRIQLWYQSSQDGAVLSPRTAEPIIAKSGETLNFTKFKIAPGFRVEVWLEMPQGGKVHRIFDYDPTGEVFRSVTEN